MKAVQTIVPGTPFSVLLPVYYKDSAAHLRRAVESATLEQTRRPAEVVIVRDGPVPASLAQELDRLQECSPVPIRIIRLPHNVGLAGALTVGLAECTYEVVARADADDICLPHRFAIQLPLIEGGLDLVGAALVEFEDESCPGRVRSMPATRTSIARYARWADPFNHPTVVYRKTAVLEAGGYQHVHLMEDYLLFARMIAAGALVSNVPQVLVKYRIGAGAYARRGGTRLLRAELELQRAFRAEGFVTQRQYLRNTVLRGGYRMTPEAVRRPAYRVLILGRNAARAAREQGRAGAESTTPTPRIQPTLVGATAATVATAGSLALTVGGSRAS